MARSKAWTSGPVTLIKGKDDVLALRQTQPGDNPAMIFKADELDILFATMVKSKHAVRSNHLWLCGENGGIAAEIEQEDKHGKSYRYAYTREQIGAFEAKSFTLREKPAYRGSVPALFAFWSEKPEPVKSSSGLERAERPTADKPTLQRATKR